MTQNTAYGMLENITVGMTSVVNGQAVTRWSENTYEVGTWGRETMDVHHACDAVLESK